MAAPCAALQGRRGGRPCASRPGPQSTGSWLLFQLTLRKLPHSQASCHRAPRRLGHGCPLSEAPRQHERGGSVAAGCGFHPVLTDLEMARWSLRPSPLEDSAAQC